MTLLEHLPCAKDHALHFTSFDLYCVIASIPHLTTHKEGITWAPLKRQSQPGLHLKLCACNLKNDDRQQKWWMKRRRKLNTSRHYPADLRCGLILPPCLQSPCFPYPWVEKSSQAPSLSYVQGTHVWVLSRLLHTHWDRKQHMSSWGAINSKASRSLSRTVYNSSSWKREEAKRMWGSGCTRGILLTGSDQDLWRLSCPKGHKLKTQTWSSVMDGRL